MLELAARFDAGVPVPSQVIAEHRDIPEKYLTHILLQLKRGGLVRSMRGAQGGHSLVDAPEKIVLLDIIEAIDGPIIIPSNTEDTPGSELCVIWETVARDTRKALQRLSLRKMLDVTTRTNMYHI
jgi:Rrf2 family transcriptional regulator, cysteine metabolism repressor